MERIETDICVIGAGSGGLSVASGAVQMGARVVLVEGGEMGGDCLNYGCVPSKALIAAGRHAHAMQEGAPFGVAPVAPQVDYAAAKDHVQHAIDTIAPVDSQERFEKLGVRVIRAWARFVSESELEAGDTRITARRFVIATGSSPLVPDIPGLGEVEHYTNETIFGLRERPEHLVVVGGGPIGMELAQAHVRLGSKVTLIEGDKVLPKDDREAAAIVLDRLRAEGVEVIEGAHAQKVARREGGLCVTTEKGEVHGSHLLIAVGRSVNLQRLDLDRAGVDHDKAVKVDDRMRTSNRRIYAVGDAAGGMQFTHVAGYHASTVLRPLLFGLPAKVKTGHLPWVTYTEPPLAQVGLTEAQARETHGDALEVVRADHEHNDRAITERRTKGFVKVMVVRGRPVGATIVGAGADDLIATWALALSAKLKMRDIAGMVAPYPTLGELNKRAAGNYFAPRLFESQAVKRVVRLVQRLMP
jgi:pyruvate/2-oxoglutarate dehydrogenase complex dihydrolipoamide dehydrogenase (E3) component